MTQILYVLILASIAAVASAQQDPGGNSALEAQAEEGQGIIRGKVVSAKTGDPLPTTHILLMTEPRGRMRVGPPLTREGYSGTDGTFVFAELPAGSYRLFPEKIGFSSQRSFNEVRIKLGAKQTREGVVIRMAPASVATGRVVDAFGEPLAEARVVALFRNFGQSWNQWSGVAEARTDDRGEYRISGLPPGKFIIAAEPPNPPSPNGVAYREFAASFFPGVDRPEQATFLKVAPGEEINGIDFKLGLAPEGSIEGVVVDGATGEPCDRCAMMFLDSAGLWGFNTSPTREGIFVMRGVQQGEGWLVARVNGPSRQMVAEKLTVAGSGTSEVKIVVAQPHTLTGEVVLENPPKEEEQQPQEQTPEGSGQQSRGRGRSMIMLEPDRPSFGGQLRAIVPEKGGPFEIENVISGPYKVSFRAANMDPATSGYVRAVSIDGRQLDSPEITMPDGELLGLKLHIAFDGASLSGTVKFAEKAEALLQSRMLVILMPDGELNPYQTRQMIAVEPDDGTFSQGSIPPGSYTAYATPNWEEFNLYDPEVRTALESIAKKITLKKNEKATLELTLASELP